MNMTMEVLTDCSAIADVKNNNNSAKAVDCQQQAMSPPSSTSVPTCVGCSGPIVDQFILKVQPDLDWHMNCLKCSECSRHLDETCTCYFRDGKTYCKQDYQRLFLAPNTCSKCCGVFSKTDYVMRADNNIYHTDCFRCTACSRQLLPGDEFSLREGGLFCREDSEVLDRSGLIDNGDRMLQSLHHNNNNHIKLNDKQRNSLQDSCSNKHKRKDGKPTRVRTVLSEKQLHTLRTCYGANPRPDALMKEQLVEMTGLSPRVIRVWFQNKRCKDKKKSMMLKHLQQQEKTMPGSMQGVQMVAQSPLRHDTGLQSIEAFHHQSWKRIPEYPTSQHEPEINHNTFPSIMSSIYSSDDSAVYLGDDEYMDCLQPGSVSSQFSGASTSPHSSG